jgi:signal transduction histidine kinase
VSTLGPSATGHEASLLWTLEEISHLVSHSGDAAETLTNIVLLIQRRFETDVCSVYLLETDRSHLLLSATVGLAPSAVGKVRMRLTEGLVGLVAEQLQPQVVPDATKHRRFKYFPETGEDPYHSFLGVPILDRGLLQGVLVVQTIEPRAFSDGEVRMLMTAGTQVAPIVSDARLEQRRAVENEIVQRAKTELVQTLAGGIAHELNNKLMPVLGFSELLIEEANQLGSTKLQEYGRAIHQSVLEAARIIRQLLQLSKPSAGEHIACDFREILNQALKLVNQRIKEAGIRLVVQLPDHSIVVKADAGQLKQVFVNLVWNAIDAMEGVPDRHLLVRLEDKSGFVTLTCVDRGQGIGPDVLPRIFDPFFTTKEPSRGTGLGLSVCLAIVKQHGGEIRVQSAPGAGTSFHVILPVHSGSLAPASEVNVMKSASATLNGHRVLVVDDEEPVLQMIARSLESTLGCHVERARNGIEAQAALKRAEFTLVVSDVRMPSMNGVELLGWLTEHRPDVLRKTVFMTGDGNSSALNVDIERARRPLIQKPFAFATLLDVVLPILADSEPPRDR